MKNPFHILFQLHCTLTPNSDLTQHEDALNNLTQFCKQTLSHIQDLHTNKSKSTIFEYLKILHKYDRAYRVQMNLIRHYQLHSPDTNTYYYSLLPEPLDTVAEYLRFTGLTHSSITPVLIHQPSLHKLKKLPVSTPKQNPVYLSPSNLSFNSDQIELMLELKHPTP